MASRRAHSKVKQLPPRLRQAISDAIVRHGKTYDEVAALVNEWVRRGKVKPEDAPSRAGLGRFGRKELARLEKVELAREYARAVVAKVDEYGMTLDEGATNTLLSELMAVMMQRDPEEPMAPADLARMMAGLGKLQQSSAAREKIRVTFEKKLKEARSRAIEAARSEGLSDEGAARIGESVQIYLPANQR